MFISISFLRSKKKGREAAKAVLSILKIFNEPSMPYLVEQKLNQGKLGEVILNALLQFEMGIEGNLKDLSESL